VERTAWTDERLDDLAQTLDTHVGQLREEVHGLREDMREEFRNLRDQLAASQRQITQIGWGLVAVFAAALITALLALIL
jgi:hypothetical protein